MSCGSEFVLPTKVLARDCMRQLHACPAAEIYSSHMLTQWVVQSPPSSKSEDLSRRRQACSHHGFNQHAPALQFITQASICSSHLGVVLSFTFLMSRILLLQAFLKCSANGLRPDTIKIVFCMLIKWCPRGKHGDIAPLCQNRFWEDGISFTSKIKTAASGITRNVIYTKKDTLQLFRFPAWIFHLFVLVLFVVMRHTYLGLAGWGAWVSSLSRHAKKRYMCQGITLGLSLEIPLQLFNIHKNLAADWQGFIWGLLPLEP